MHALINVKKNSFNIKVNFKKIYNLMKNKNLNIFPSRKEQHLKLFNKENV